MKIYKTILFALAATCLSSVSAQQLEVVTSDTRVSIPPVNSTRPSYSSGQIDGDFYVYSDRRGKQMVYFKGINKSRYDLTRIRVICINDRLRDRLDFNLTLRQGEPFAIGRIEGWTWQAGERLIIQLPNGQTAQWTYDPRRVRRAPSAVNVRGVECPGYVSPSATGNSYPGMDRCQNCGLSIREHSF